MRLKIKEKNIPIFFVFAILPFLSGYILSKQYGVWINHTESFKEKIFIIEKNYPVDKIKKGDIVVFLFPYDTKYIKKNMKAVKVLACDEGEYLYTVNEIFFCNSDIIAKAKKTDSHGEKIEQFNFNGFIPKNKMFLNAPNENSFDSRYYGFIDKNLVVGKVILKI